MDRFEWKSISRGDKIPDGAILGGRTSTDGEVFVGRQKSGEVGKLNLNNGTMWNIWCHKGKDKSEGEILVVDKECPIQWVSVSKGNALPADSVLAGEFNGDGAIYPCRRGGAVGKLNLNHGKVYNMWFHGEWFAKSDGEILVVGPQGAGKEWAEHYEHASGGEAHGFGAWVKNHKGALEIAGAVAAAAAVGLGIAAAEGAFKKGDQKPSGDAGYAPGAAPGAPPAAAPSAQEDPKNYDENAFCDGVTAGERVAWLCKEQGMTHEEAVQTVMQEFPQVFTQWWKPHADCDGVSADERAKWLVNNKGMSMEDARKQVRDEFPGVFGAGAGGAHSKPHFVDGKFPHTMQLTETDEGPKLQISVTPRNPEDVSLVAFHYQINQGQPMNFDVSQDRAPDGTYVHQTPGGGGYPTCPRGSEVSYWLYTLENGIGNEEPEGSGANPDRRMFWTSR